MFTGLNTKGSEALEKALASMFGAEAGLGGIGYKGAQVPSHCHEEAPQQDTLVESGPLVG